MPNRSKKNTLSHRKQVLIDLALQGGGAHGAYTWGVLDRLLEEPRLRIEGISGTSAGSMNAAVLVSGYINNGAEGARAALEEFWRRVSRAALFSPFQRSFLDILSGRWTLNYSPWFIAFNFISRLLSPYDLNPIAFHPLRSILLESINFEELAEAPIKLFITVTNVRTGKGKIFRNGEITPEVLLASACMPTLFQAIEIDGEAYWDGGFSGNPTITPLIQECESSDTVLVQINPIERTGIPKSAPEILNRINEVAFNATLIKELRMIAVLRQVVDTLKGECARWAKMRIHRIASSKMVELGYSSKLNAEWSFLCMLRDEGRRTADNFLIKYGKDLNRRSSFDLDSLL
ncbi:MULTISPECIES: patatin-like phospholipase family protein [unclassified Legionella]|uniref:patatin-like phospholipase family protein n=1 Tax=unclassified Legionella TaxID=2622702 RepID=UPI0010552029|nr:MULTISPECIES: patatin-like phospholipase family protein [unclassified Legionella]MDI9818600.1 patatin-like phospholipase family protein [Legionella sp. PL877]